MGFFSASIHVQTRMINGACVFTHGQDGSHCVICDLYLRKIIETVPVPAQGGYFMEVFLTVHDELMSPTCSGRFLCP